MRASKIRIVAVVLGAIFAAIYADALGHGFVKDDFRWIATPTSIPPLICSAYLRPTSAFTGHSSH
jgi:hypothetical protein